MKQSFAFAVFLSLSVSLYAQSEQEKAQKVVIDFFEALSAMDNRLIDPLVTKDFILLEMGEVWNADTLKNKMVLPKGIKFKRTNFLDFIKTDVQNNIAWISYHNRAEIVWNDGVRMLRWLESAVLIKEDGVWKMSLLHSTKVPIAEVGVKEH
ncbi:MAG: nuclear transport factor 2 family protein [Chitinophagaceae bacterium]|nr:MAG: nuclear transport factor 2 family protein [Chitinophagaceae bacterium]